MYQNKLYIQFQLTLDQFTAKKQLKVAKHYFVTKYTFSRSISVKFCQSRIFYEPIPDLFLIEGSTSGYLQHNNRVSNLIFSKKQAFICRIIIKLHDVENAILFLAFGSNFQK